MQIYEYIFTAAIIFAILIAATLLVSITPQLTINTSEIDQLKMAAQKTMTQITLNPGNPTDWGSNITISANDLTSFGLATYTEFTKHAYVLDPDKVQRLENRLPNDLHIPPSKAIELLNLVKDYGLKIEFIPALKLNCTNNSGNFVVNVASEQNMPLANADVAARIFYISGGQIQKTELKTAKTGINGNCLFNFNGAYETPALLVLAADYQGIQMMNITMIGDSHEYAYFIGASIIPPSSIITREAYQIIITKFSNGSLVINDVPCVLKPKGNSVYELGYLEPHSVAVVIGEDSRFIVGFKQVPLNYSSISGSVASPLAYMLERAVRIGFSTYTLRLYVWRMSW